MERWRSIIAAPSYEVSDLGRIRSIGRTITDSRGRSYYRSGTVRALSTAPNGYLRFNTGRCTLAVHVAVLEAFAGPRPSGAHGAHGDGVKANCRLDNLRWATPAENAADKAVHGTTYRPIGTAHPAAKLTDDQVRQVKRLHARCVMQSHIADLTGISRKTINSIVRGKSWKHITVEQSDRRAMGRVG